jgi:hypothetical protein
LRVTIAVEGVQREIEVRPDLLLPGMGEWQDATEMDLLIAFGSAYKEAVAVGVAAAEAAAVAVVVPQTAPEASPEVAPEASFEVAPEAAPQVAPEDAAALAHPVEPIAVLSDYDPEDVPQDTPFAETPEEDFGQVQPYVASEDDAEAFLSPVPSGATQAPNVTQCRCGHAIAWHSTEVVDETGPCLMAWPIDEHDPQGPSSRCSCLIFEPADVRPPSA